MNKFLSWFSVFGTVLTVFLAIWGIKNGTLEEKVIVSFSAIIIALFMTLCFLIAATIKNTRQSVQLQKIQDKNTRLLQDNLELNQEIINSQKKFDEINNAYPEVKDRVNKYLHRLRSFEKGIKSLNQIIEQDYKVINKVHYKLIDNDLKINSISDVQAKILYDRNTLVVVDAIAKYLRYATKNEECAVAVLRRVPDLELEKSTIQSQAAGKKVSIADKSQIQILKVDTDSFDIRKYIKSSNLEFVASDLLPIQCLLDHSLDIVTETIEETPDVIENDIKFIIDDIEKFEKDKGVAFNNLYNINWKEYYNTVIVLSLKDNEDILPEGFLWIDSKTAGSINEDVQIFLESISKICYSLVYSINEIDRKCLKK